MSDPGGRLPAVASELVQAAGERGLTLRVTGSVGVRLRCGQHTDLAERLVRPCKDLDLAGYGRQDLDVRRFFLGLGYVEDPEVNLLFAGRRLIFEHPAHGLRVDVFFDRFDFCHEIPLQGRLEVDPLTVPPAELCLGKLQIVQITDKDLADLALLFLTHPLADTDAGAINAGVIARLCAGDWGLWRTLTTNLDRLAGFAARQPALTGEEEAQLRQQVEALRARVDREPKSARWRLRARIGERVRWYKDVDSVT